MTVKETCYMCENDAITREHVPPRCFFPVKYRNQLITVPSCGIHNLEKSKDDEYLRFVILINYENNREAQELFSTKALEGLKRRPHQFSSFIGNNGYLIKVDGKPSMAIAYDIDRYEKAVTCIAKAIHFHHFKMKWDEEIWILPVSAIFSNQHPKYKEQNARLAKLKYGEFDAPKHGENQEIFYYQFLVDVDTNIKRLRMVFYKGFVTYAVSLKLVSSKVDG